MTLGGSVTEIVYVLGAGDRVVGVDASSVYPEAATEKLSVGYFRRVPAEGVLSLDPSLILALEGTGPPSVLDQLRSAGVQVELVPDESLLRTLRVAPVQETPMMVFVGSPGCLQIHTGPVQTLRATPPWYNVLDPDFQLHLNEEMIGQTWVVQKPTTDGVVTSLELLDADGGIIARHFGKRKSGQPERDDWRSILESLPSST